MLNTGEQLNTILRDFQVIIVKNVQNNRSSIIKLSVYFVVSLKKLELLLELELYLNTCLHI